MAANMDDAVDALADDDTWMDALMVAGGYLAPSVIGRFVEGRVDLPNELYGVGAIAANEMFLEERAVTVGSGLYVVDALAQRFGLKGQVTSLAGGN